MSDLSMLINNLNRVLYNLDQKDKRYHDIFFSQTAADVTIPRINENGQTEQITIKNYAKLNQEFQTWQDQTQTNVTNTISSVMEKIVYVDYINGNDNNSGTQTSPFKTLQKAVNSVPIGGKVTIRLLNNYDLYENVRILERHIILEILENVSIKLMYRTSRYNSSFLERGYFELFNSTLRVFFKYGGKIFEDTKPDSRPIDPPSRNVFCVWSSYYGWLNINFFLNNMGTPIDNINLTNGHLIGRGNWDEATTIIGLTMYPQRNGRIRLNQANGCRLVNLDSRSIGLLSYYVGQTSDTSWIVDENGNNLSLSSVIGGIVRDSNNVPRNVISNIVL